MSATMPGRSFQLRGFRPMARRPVNPVPAPTITRSTPTRPTRVAMAAAVAIGWRSEGISTPGPRRIRSVRTAARAMVIQQSSWRAGVS